MAPTPTVYTAYSAPINPPDATPVLTREQIWQGLEIKVDRAQDFVPAITSTEIVSKSTDDHGRSVTIRDVIFKENNRRVQEVVTQYFPANMIFTQPNGSQVQNIISVGGDGGLYLTFDFQWVCPDASASELETERAKVDKMAKMAVESSITSIREMVRSGRIK